MKVGEPLKDYAYPTILAEKALKDLHEAVLRGRMEDALAESFKCLRAVADIQEALVDMKRK
jgi:hypothetical protein